MIKKFEEFIKEGTQINSDEKFFFELYDSDKYGKKCIHQSDLFDTPEEAREECIKEIEKRNLPTPYGLVFICDEDGGVPFGDESLEDEWTITSQNL